jgi:hypothetical protein
VNDVGSRWRSRRRQSLPGDGGQPILGADEQGDFEVRAWIQAELLGIRLLTVKSRVITGEPHSFRNGSSLVALSGAKGTARRPTTATKTVSRAPVPPSLGTAHEAEARQPSNGRHKRQGLEQAVALLNQCTHTLEHLSLNGGSHDG